MFIARNDDGFSDWWMRICQRNVFNCVAKSIMSGIKICKANAPTALPMDHAVEIHQIEPTWNYSHMAHIDSPRLVDLQHPSNHNPNANDIMGCNDIHNFKYGPADLFRCQTLANFKQLKPLLGT